MTALYNEIDPFAAQWLRNLITAGHIASAHGGWEGCDWIPCSDGVSRPVESRTHPLAHEVPARVGKLRAYGNAIVPQVAAAFIRAALEAA